MFNDKYGLTDAVLQGRKTMTRRIIPQHVVDYYESEAEDSTLIDAAKYRIGDVVAVAQSYSQLNKEGYLAPEWLDHTCEDSKGYSNKMYVRADLMPERNLIRITDIKVERLQDISDDDCLKEGLERVYIGNEVWYKISDTRNGIKATQIPRLAFATLIDKISGKGTWDNNPLVFVYGFELVK